MNELIKALASNLNISDAQANGGLGAIMTAAQKIMGNDFSQVLTALPGLSQTMEQAPSSESSGLMGTLSGVMSAFGKNDSTLALVTQVASQFKTLGLEPSMISQFLPVVVGFLKNSSNPGAADLIQKVVSQFKI